MRRHLVRAGLALLIAPAGFVFASLARAHAYLRRAVPPVGSTVRTAPTEVMCEFTEQLEPSFSQMEVRDAAGNSVAAGAMHLAPADAKQMVIGLTSLGPGTYTVIWHAVSVDTHRTEGRFTFTIAP